MPQVKVALITIGDEILYGQTLDTNSHWISQELDNYGFKLIRKFTVGDLETDILTVLKQAEAIADVILITGGLGPTNDDLTKPCLAKYFDVELVQHDTALKELKTLFKRIDRELSESNIAQTWLPANADYISNSMGTAPGIWIEEDQKIYVSMPGVPFEMKAMMSDFVIPKLQLKFSIPAVAHRIIKTIGIGESWLAEKIKPWEEALPEHIKLAYLPSLGQVKLRLTSSGKDSAIIEKDFDDQVSKLNELASKYIYGFGDAEIESIVGQLLIEQKLQLATAESCTGGYLAHMITRVPGSSRYFKGSIIAYSNEVKEGELNVNSSILNKYGAVSEQTVEQMALGVCDKLNVDIGLATSGIAGPDGGTNEKPVGTIWIAVAYQGQVKSRLLKLSKDRVLNIKMTATASLTLLWRILSK